MNSTINGSPSFAYIDIDLDPGESVIAESDAMASMAAELDMTARFNGGLFSAESLFSSTSSSTIRTR